VDNLAVAIAYGVKKLRIDWLSNGLIALVSALGTILSMSVGAVISRHLPPAIANGLGSGVLIAIGIIGIWDTLERERQRVRQRVRRNQMCRSMVMAGSTSRVVEATMTEGQEERGHDPTAMTHLSYETYLEHPEHADKDCSGHIDVKEAIALAVGLAINNLASGVGAGISGLSIALTAALTLIFSVASVVGGYFLGERLNVRMTGIWAGIISGLMVIGVGLYEYFIP
jgi:putative Mn2+ efflux pump MntP